VKPNEVVDLTNGQAEAFADKFERVEEQQPTA
jgi:hypothetical protein